jgi:hypothetical protein
MKRPSHLEWPTGRWLSPVLQYGVGFSLACGILYVLTHAAYQLAAQASIPLLGAYIATSALLYNRARALPSGPSKTRSLYAAERTLQAVLFTIVAIALAVAVVGWGLNFEVLRPAGAEAPLGPWDLVLMFPAMFAIWGYGSYTIGLRAIARDVLRPVSAKEIATRIRNAP